jgi:hypothetical protein
MSNDTEFSALAHNLLMKTKTAISEHQESKNRSASIQASPQAARKKRFTKLNFNLPDPTWANKGRPISSNREKEDGSQQCPTGDITSEPGLIGPKAARNYLTYV